MSQALLSSPRITVGLDLGDRVSPFCAVDSAGRVVEEGRVRTTPDALRRQFAGRSRRRVVLEVGTHSPWVSRRLAAWGHQVLVANARKLRLIYATDRKTDRVDAQTLARLGRLDPWLLAPIAHRSAEAQADLAHLRARESLVRARTQLINHVRGAVKAMGGRLPKVSAPAFATKTRTHIPLELQLAVGPLVEQIAALTRQIRAMERHLAAVAVRYPAPARLQQVAGVGPLTALCFVLTLEDPARFPKSRDVGAYLGLVPRQRASGASVPQLSISKRGDEMLRRYLVLAAHYVLGPFGPPCDLRSWGLRLAARGGKNAKKRAVVAVARRLATLLHALWIHDSVYEPNRLGTTAAA